MLAHVNRDSSGNWMVPHELEEHLKRTAELCAVFADKFDSKDWGYLLGVSHDIGKSRDKWQKYLLEKSGFPSELSSNTPKNVKKIPHAIHSSLAFEHLAQSMGGQQYTFFAYMLSYVTAGHHSGLPDWSGLRKQAINSTELSELDEKLMNWIKLNYPMQLPLKLDVNSIAFSIWLRMLFSCLVDADYLDTEAYMKPSSASERGNSDSIDVLHSKFMVHSEKFMKDAKFSNINTIRTSIFNKCVDTAKMPQGIFSLTVPTGGGKTLSSLAFALEHAKKHQLERIIYVLPYTSIIEQNASVYKDILGEQNVLEHHSNVSEDMKTNREKLASENWDIPVIVTTNVQFFESLFSASPKKCRKLHRIAKSVVILDEVQMLPPQYLRPILETFEELQNNYGVSLVLSTATQPFLENLKSIGLGFTGLEAIREIIGSHEEVADLFQKMERVDIEFPKDIHERMTLEEIRNELLSYDSILCVVSDRRTCSELHSLMPTGTYHLSANMCPKHRKEKIKLIKTELNEGKVVRVISTQVIEAGVDVDFPVVYRALAGLDSIVQAAGRCNREGRMARGLVKVFNPPRKPPAGLLRKACDATLSMMPIFEERPIEPTDFKVYFQKLYSSVRSTDEKEICNDLKPRITNAEFELMFKTASEKFKIVEENCTAIIVPYKESIDILNDIRINGFSYHHQRQLQPYIISIYENTFNDLKKIGGIETIGEGVHTLSSSLFYTEEKGLITENFNVDDFII